MKIFCIDYPSLITNKVTKEKEDIAIKDLLNFAKYARELGIKNIVNGKEWFPKTKEKENEF